MIDNKVIHLGAAGIIIVFLGLLIFDAVSIEYVVPLPLYGTIGLIFGGGAALGIRNRHAEKSEETKKSGGKHGTE